jgi:hypothetical protein
VTNPTAKRRSKKPAEHPCWAKVNAAIADRNAELDMATTISIGSAEMGSALYIPLRRLNPRKQGLTKLMPVFCPFCGEKLP